MKCTTLNVTPANFEAAFAKARSIFEKKGDHEVTMSFAGGTYDLATPVVMDASAFPGKAHLRMIGGGRIKTVFTALESIPADAFRPVAGKPYYVYQFDKQADGSYPNLRAVYANQKIVDVSRTSEYRSTPKFERGEETYATNQTVFNTTHMIYVPMAAIDEAGLENCVGAELHIRVEWEFKIFHIARIDTEDFWMDDNGQKHVAMHLAAEESNGGNGGLSMYSRVFFICNTTSVLTTPGQYTYERAVGKLYYYPAGNIADCKFGISKQTNLFELNNFASLTMKGLTFTGIEDAILTHTGYYAAGQAGSWSTDKFPEIFPHAGAVKVSNVEEADIDGCTFTDLPCDGISMVGVLNNVTIRNSRFTNIGATAMRIGRPKDYSEADQINNIRIENNYLDNIGFTYENSCSILVTKVKGGKLNHNTVLRSSYSAFSLGWKWNVADWEYGAKVNLENVEVAYNYIRAFVMNMRDGGGIYTLGGNVNVGHAAFMNTLHDNYVIEDELTCPENGFFGSLYHDGASSNWHTFNNIVIHNPALTGSTASYSARIYLQAAWPVGVGSTEGQATWHILCENNYICCCKNFGEVYRSQAVDPEKASNMLDASRDLREINTHMLKSAKELKKYPEAVRIMAESGCTPNIGKK